MIGSYVPEIIVFVYGLIVGSFLNVCIYRIPRGESFGLSRSRCPSCGAPILYRDLVPVASWLILKGACRRCGSRISPMYPAVELLNGLCWLCAYRAYGFAPGTPLTALLLSALIVVAGVDLGHRIIPYSLNAAVAVLAIPYIVFASPEPLTSHIIGAFVVSLPFYAVAVITNGSLGGGDVMLMAAAGLFLGYRLVLFALLAGSVVGAIVCLGLMAAKKAGMKTAVPFGPFLAFGLGLAALWGREIIDWYFRLFIR